VWELQLDQRLAHELGIETGIDIDALIEADHLAESIVGHHYQARR